MPLRPTASQGECCVSRKDTSQTGTACFPFRVSSLDTSRKVSPATGYRFVPLGVRLNVDPARTWQPRFVWAVFSLWLRSAPSIIGRYMQRITPLHMQTIEIWWIIAPVITCLLLAVWGAMTAKRIGWFCFAISFLPIMVMTAISGSELPSMWSRILLSGVVGGIGGALILIGIIEVFHVKAEAQVTGQNQPPAPPSSSSGPGQAPPAGASGNFSFGQQGGTTTQTYINQAPPKLTFTDELGNELLAKLPKRQT